MRDPDISSVCGRVWSAQFDAADAPAHVASWLAHIPGAHPAWSYYSVSLVSLADKPGLPPAKMQFPEATHEIIVSALNPEVEKQLDPDDPATWQFLTPVNLVAQFKVNSDTEATRVAYDVVTAFCDGRLNPDTDFRQHTLDAIAQTAACIVAGKHPVN